MGILEYYNSASMDIVASGLAWYHDANTRAESLASDYNVPLHIVAATISILSPGISWERNILEANMSLDAWHNGKPWPALSTYGSQVAKLRALLEDMPNRMDVLDYIGTPRALKTRAFYHNILEPDAKEYVTVDRWMLRAAGYTGDRITKSKYVDITNEVKRIAKADGIVPCQVQAIVWQNIRSSVTDDAADLPGW